MIAILTLSLWCKKTQQWVLHPQAQEYMVLTPTPFKELHGWADCVASTTTVASVSNTRLFRMTLTALTEPRTLWRTITRFPSPSRRVGLHTYILYFRPGMRWRIHTICKTHVFHCLQWLQLCCSRLHNAWRCLCLSLGDSHMPYSHLCLALRFCYLLQYCHRFGYITCCSICFAIIIFYKFEIYCPFFTLSSTMPSVLHILH